MSYLIRGLEPSSQYEARVQARNRFGWNQISEIFRFSTRAIGNLILSLIIFFLNEIHNDYVGRKTKTKKNFEFKF